MKRFSLNASLAGLLLVPAFVSAAETTEGLPYFNACVSDPPQSAGIYRFSTSEYAPEQIKRNVYASGGGIADDNYYYGVRYEVIGGFPVIECTSYVLRNWSVEDNYTNCKITNVATDLAYFAPRDEAYGCFFNEAGTGYVFGKCKLSQFSCTKIADLQTAFAAMDFDAAGTLYAIDWKGDLVTVDLRTGAQTLIGSTGKTTSMITGGAIDRTSGRFYLSVRNDGESALYRVDLKTAETVKVYDLENNEQLGGIYFPEEYDNSAPAASSAPTLNFSSTSLEGTVRFRAPQKSVSGDLLTDAVTYHVEANGVEVAGGSAKYEDGYMSVPVAVTAPGQYCFSLYFSNEAGRGPRSKSSLYVGPDIPKAPINPRMTYKDGTVKLFWTAAGSTGVNGGNIDRTDMYYKITRYPDGEVFTAEASGWSQEIAQPAVRTTYRYDIQVVAGGLESEAVSTDPFSLGPVVPPYAESFSTLNSTIGWSWINNESYEEDNYTAANGLRLVTMNRPDEGVYLVTPTMNLTAGNRYTLTLSLRCGNSSYAEKFEVVAGTEPGVFTQTVLPATDLQTDQLTVFETEFVPSADGLHYIAIKGTSEAGRMMYLKEFSISKGVSDAAPGAATDLIILPDQTGLRKVTVSFKAPAVTLSGEVLTSLTSAELLRDGESVKTITEGVAPGAELTIVDDTEPSTGVHTYSVVCHNDAGNGTPVSGKVWVGFNRPEPVSRVTVKETSTLGTVDISWAEATVDIDGKPLEGAQITYNLYDRNYELIKSGLEETSVTIRAIEHQAAQQWVQYRVEAVSEGGGSDLAKSILVPVGVPDKAPWRESWAGKESTYMIGTTANSVGDQWRPVGGFEYKDRIVDPQDGDGGMMGLENTVPDETIAMFTGKIDLSEVFAPSFTFWVYNYVGDNGKDNANELAVKIWGDDDEDFTSLATIIIGQTGPQRQWNKVTVPLDGYEGQTVRLRVEATVVTAIYVHIDNMEVNTSSACNLTATALQAPVSVNPGNEFEISFMVTNTGDAPFDAAEAVLYRDGEEAAVSQIGALASGQRRRIAFSETLSQVAGDVVAYRCGVRGEGDLIPDDDVTSELTVAVRRNGHPTVSNLKASSDSRSITLSWDEPDLAQAAPSAVTEGFESCPAWQSAVEGWTFLDLDRATIGGIGKKQLPVSGQQSFFVINDTYAALNNPNDGDRFKAHGGNQALWSMYSMRGTTYVQSDDWAISPELYGGPQTVSLWASSFKSDAGEPQYLETFQVLASSTGTDPEDFSLIETIENLPAEWTRYEFYLPQGSRYLAVRGISYDKYLLMVDDIEFIPVGGQPRGLSVNGYNVWRDGVCLTSAPVPVCSYVDEEAVAGTTHRYRVTAHYGVDGESAGSDEVEASLMSGVMAAAESSAAISVKAADGNIIIRGADGLTVFVNGVDGRLVASSECSAETRLPVAPGIYLVSVGGNTVKLIVR